MKAGVELDQLISHLFFGFFPLERGIKKTISAFPPFSLDLEAAKVLQRHLESLGFEMTVHGKSKHTSGRRVVRFTKEDKIFRGRGDSLAHAICEADIFFDRLKCSTTSGDHPTEDVNANDSPRWRTREYAHHILKKIS